VERPYVYVDQGGAAAATAALQAQGLEANEQAVIKSLVMKESGGGRLMVLMHGHLQVSTKALARVVLAKNVQPATAKEAQQWTGYQVGGISPFGIRESLPIYVQESILALSKIWINGGKRGLLIEIDPRVLVDPLGALPVDCAIPG